MFTVDFTRQFDISDVDGGHDRYVQVHCELRYEPETALDSQGYANVLRSRDSVTTGVSC